MVGFTEMAAQLGMPVWLFTIIMIWSMAWKIAALWKSAQDRALFWFIVIALVNTVGILEILYIFLFSKHKHLRLQRIKKPVKEAKKAKPKKKKSKRK